MNEVKTGEIYRHFKGDLYQVVAVATHSETKEKFVVYQALYDDMQVWIRPYDMFIEELDREIYPDAEQRFRFELMNTVLTGGGQIIQYIAKNPKRTEVLRQQGIISSVLRSDIGDAACNERKNTSVPNVWGKPDMEDVLHKNDEESERRAIEPAIFSELKEAEQVRCVIGPESSSESKAAEQVCHETKPEESVLNESESQVEETTGYEEKLEPAETGLAEPELAGAKLIEPETAKSESAEPDVTEPEAIEPEPIARGVEFEEEEPPYKKVEYTVRTTYEEAPDMPEERPIEVSKVKEEVPKGSAKAEVDGDELADKRLIKFLDAKTYQDKINYLTLMRNSIDDKLINDIAAVMDITVDEGPIDTRYFSLKSCLQTKAKYECARR